MANVIRVSVNSLRFSLDPSQPTTAPLHNQRLFKRVVSNSESSAPVTAEFAEFLSPVIVRPRKQLGSFKVRATLAEKEQPKWWERSGGPNMIDIHSTQEFLKALSEAGDRLVIVEFYGTWCASCKALYPKLCRTAAEHPEILFLKVNFDENKPMCKSLNVKVLPFFHFYRGADGQLEAFSCSLAKFQKIKDAIEQHNTARCSIGLLKALEIFCHQKTRLLDHLCKKWVHVYI